MAVGKRLRREYQMSDYDENHINEISDCLRSYSEDFAKNSAERFKSYYKMSQLHNEFILFKYYCLCI